MREEFEKAFVDAFGRPMDDKNSAGLRNGSLWAARWMAERCAQHLLSKNRRLWADEIRQMARELG